MAELRFLTV
jgi:hypothetical protein